MQKIRLYTLANGVLRLGWKLDVYEFFQERLALPVLQKGKKTWIRVKRFYSDTEKKGSYFVAVVTSIPGGEENFDTIEIYEMRLGSSYYDPVSNTLLELTQQGIFETRTGPTKRVKKRGYQARGPFFAN